MVTTSPGASAASCGDDDAGAGEQHRSGGHVDWIAIRYSISVFDFAVQLRRRSAAGERLPSPRSDRAGHLEIVGIGQFVRRDDHRTERAAGRVYLRLRQVERILALDVPGRNIVGERVADDLALGCRAPPPVPARAR